MPEDFDIILRVVEVAEPERLVEVEFRLPKDVAARFRAKLPQ